ncbi:MAG TPA: SUMF1/EgtB/PvdO family nonheme iron enzyme [Chitinophagaceae bacterium]|nr:SUMF1/EgtB/PvdO family nonheme iron enzyme [Chitinophagaceae bacterium]
MPKFTTTIFLAFISLGSFAQKSNLSLEKLGLKNLLPHVSYIPAKSFNSLVYTGKDSVSSYSSRTSSVQGFYISQTEVTNKEYREFVFYVRDSIAHALLQHFHSGSNTIDWDQKIDWKDERLEALMLSPEERVFGRKETDPLKFIYTIDFFGKKECIGIYPDTLVWLRDFSYSYNEPLAKKYFSHSSYNNYPAVGISQKQAMAFCQWKTEQINKMLKGKEASAIKVTVKLPSNAEWESAAFELKDSVSIFDGNKGYSCNFGIITTGLGLTKKGFKDDGYFYTAPVKSFPPGVYGLYDMKGNIAEWTSTARDEIMNVEVRQEKLKTVFIVKGGGWNSTPFYLQAGVCQFFPVEDAHSFIGFRYVVHIEKK